VQHCKDHEDEVLKLFCKACKQVICRDCALVKHRDHDFVFIREIRPEIQQQLESLTKDVQAKEVEYKSYIDYMENIREIGTDTLASCEREVNDTCHRLQEAIESRRATLIAQLHNIHDLEKKQVNSEADSLQFTLEKLSNSIGFTQQLLANGSDVEVVSMGVQAMQTLENMKHVNWNKDSVKPTLMRVKFDPNFEKHVNEFGATSHEIHPEDILISGLPKESSVNQEIQFKVCMSEEISEKGYVAAGLVIQLTHTSTNSETVCSMRKIDLNTWAVSCIPKAAGIYKVSATLDHIETTPLTLNIPEPEAQPVCEARPVCEAKPVSKDSPSSVDSKSEKNYYMSTHTKQEAQTVCVQSAMVSKCSEVLPSSVDFMEDAFMLSEDTLVCEKPHNYSYVEVPKSTDSTKKTCASPMKGSSVSSVQHAYTLDARKHSSYETSESQRSTIMPLSEHSKQPSAPVKVEPPQLVESWSSSKSVGATTSRAEPQRGKFQSYSKPLKDDWPHPQYSSYADVWALPPTVADYKSSKTKESRRVKSRGY